MSFSYSAGVITQTGTDTNLSGLNGLTGVTRTIVSAGSGTFQGLTRYRLDSSTRLVINGTLSHDPDSETLVLQYNDATVDPSPYLNPLSIAGTYNYGSSQTFQTGTVYEAGCGIQILGYLTGSQRQFYASTAGIYIQSGGTFNWKGATILSARSIISDGALNIENATFVPRCTDTTTKDYCPRIGYLSGSGSLDGLTVLAANGHYFGMALDFAPSTISNYQVVGTNDGSSAIAPALVGSPDFTLPFLKASNIPSLAEGNLYAGRAFKGRMLEITNYENGVDLKDELSDKDSTAPSAVGAVLALKQFSANFKDTAGSNVQDMKLYISEVSDGNEPPASVNTSFTAEDISYLESVQTFTHTSDASGNTPSIELALFFGYKMTAGAVMTENVRTKAGTNELDSFYIGYNYIVGSSPIDVSGIGARLQKYTAVSDVLITEATKATVDAYTTIDTARELYDRAKAYLVDDFAGETSTTISRSGAQAELAAINLTIDSAAGSAYALAAGTITIKSTTFTGGATATTGAVTVQGATELNGGTFDCDITYASTNNTITGVTCTGTFTVTGAISDYRFVNCNITTLDDSAGGAVTIRAINTTITTDSGVNTTVNYYSAITLTVKDGATPKSGALVGYWDDTNTDRTYNSSFVNGALTSDGSGLVSGYVLYRVDGTTYTGISLYTGLATYQRYRVPQTPTGAAITQDILLTADTFYTATPSTGTTITWGSSLITQAGNTSTQGMYDYFIQQWYTAANIYRGRILLGSGTGFEICSGCTVTISSGTITGGAWAVASGSTLNANGGVLDCGANVIGTLNAANLTALGTTGSFNMQGGTLDLADLTSEQIQGSFASGTVDLDSLVTPTATQLDLRNVTGLGAGLTIKNDSNENITVKKKPSQTSPTLDITGPGTGTLTINADTALTYSALLQDSYVRLYNETQSTEIELTTLAGAGYTTDIPNGTGAGKAEVGDTVRIDVALYRTSGTIYEPLTQSFTVADTGNTLTGSQTVWTILQNIHAKGTAYEGPNVTGFSLDVPNIEVDSSATQISGWKLDTWLYYQIATTADGIRNYFKCFTKLNIFNSEVDASQVDLKIDNTGLPATWVDAAWTRSDGASVIADTSATVLGDLGLINVVIPTDTTPDVNIIQVQGTSVTDVNDFKADVSSLATTSALATVDSNVDAILSDTNELQTNQGNWLTATGFATSANLATVDSNVDSILTIAQLLNKYHDNNVKFFESDGTTETTQALAYRMVVYDDDGTTPIKTILFKDALGAGATLTDATRYEQ